jgi:hypothetical protein
VVDFLATGEADDEVIVSHSMAKGIIDRFGSEWLSKVDPTCGFPNTPRDDCDGEDNDSLFTSCVSLAVGDKGETTEDASAVSTDGSDTSFNF